MVQILNIQDTFLTETLLVVLLDKLACSNYFHKIKLQNDVKITYKPIHTENLEEDVPKWP
jgi:hypothetical protein